MDHFDTKTSVTLTLNFFAQQKTLVEPLVKRVRSAAKLNSLKLPTYLVHVYPQAERVQRLALNF
jgi:hypothetical protein